MTLEPNVPVVNAQGSGEPPEQGHGDGKTFTQDELNRVVSDRLARERGKYADYDDLKKQAAKLQKIEDAQKSELERAQEARKAAEDAAKAATANADQRLMQAEFLAAAALAGVAHPEDAYALADKTAVLKGDNGALTGVNEAVKALVDAGRLVMSGRPPAPNLNGGAGGGERTSDKKLSLTPEQEQAARNMGVSLADYAKQLATQKR